MSASARQVRVGFATVLAAATVVLGAGCFPVAQPRLPQDVGAALAQHPMRRLETADLFLYYPEGRNVEAWRFATRIEGCVGYLRRAAHVHNGVADQKMIAILPELAFNNAFVSPRISGYETLAVVPTYNTLEAFSLEFGLPPDPAAIGCHELTHYVHFQQIAGFAWFWNAFGDVYSPQIGFDPWFDEGLAVYYETKLQPGTGRLAWPFWRGAFAAGFAGRRLHGGDLSAFQRDYHAGSYYLVGSQFVRFLADRYGEDKLWKLIDVQARSIFFPLFVNIRFWQAYDKTLSTLIDEFADEVAASLHDRGRPPDQRVVRAVGNNARYARAPDGTEALLASDLDKPAWLAVYGPDGRLRSQRRLADILPPRTLSVAAPTLASGLTFSPDGRWLYFVAIDLDATYQAARLYRYDVDAATLEVVHRDLRGPGGSLTPDGSRYVFAQANGDHHDLAELDLASGAIRVIAQEPHGAFVANPRVSPDGKRVVATRFDGERFRIVLIDAHDGTLLATLPTNDDPVHDASWVDDRRIVFLAGGATDAGFQVYDYDLDSGRFTKLTDAPFLAFQPSAADGRTLRFLNREGWSWTLDEIPLPPRAPVQAAAPPPPVSPLPPRDTPVNVIPTVVSDAPASPIDQLFVPHLYGPTLGAAGRAGEFVGLVLAGNDRLEKHRWALAGYYQFIGSGHGGGSFAYSNRQFAPLTLTLSASQFSFADIPPVINNPTPTLADFTLERRERDLSFDALRLFYENPVSLGFSFIESYRPGDPGVLIPLQRIAGPHLSATYAGAATSPYVGGSPLFTTSIDAAAYPRPWNSAGFGFYDLRGEVASVLPLPFYRRHTLTLDGRVRDLVGSPAGERMLRVGGYTLVPLARRSDQPERTIDDYPFLPPAAAFVEPLRGFEDYPLAVDRIGIASARYRLPFIIDYGWASTLWILPALFVQQIDFDLFGVAATDGSAGDKHTAAGGALSLRLAFWLVPITLQYQLAHRFTDDHAYTQLIQIGM